MSHSGRVESGFVLLLIQGASWLLAGLAAVIFGIAGERVMLLLALLTVLLGWSTFFVAVALLLRARRVRRLVLGLEWLCLIWSLIQVVLPLGNGVTPVLFLTGVALPITVLALLHGRRARLEFQPLS